jgi:GNAT superfamily N-acetyltransferase
MLAGMNGVAPAPATGPWIDIAERTLRRRLADPDSVFAAYVVDRPGRAGGLAACALGVIESRLGTPDNPSGEIGYVYNVATDPEYRRRGYSRACMEALLSWFRQRAVVTVDLRASPDGEPLYRRLGFRPVDTAMRLSIHP